MPDKGRQTLGFLAGDMWLRLLSLVLAVGLWLWVQEGQVEEHKARVRLRWILPPELVAARPLPNVAAATFRGPHAAIRRAKERGPEATIDLSKQGPGTHRVDLATVEVAPLSPEVVVVGWNEPVMAVELDERRTRRLPVEPQTAGSLPPGLRIASLTVKPRTVEISGPKSLVDEMRSVSTRPVLLDDVTASAQVPVEVLLPRNVSLEGPYAGTADLRVEQGLDARDLEGVPVLVWAAPDWAASGPSRVDVRVTGPAGALRALGAEDVAVVVYLPEDPGDRFVAHASADGPGYRLVAPGHADVTLERGPSNIEVVRR